MVLLLLSLFSLNTNTMWLDLFAKDRLLDSCQYWLACDATLAEWEMVSSKEKGNKNKRKEEKISYYWIIVFLLPNKPCICINCKESNIYLHIPLRRCDYFFLIVYGNSTKQCQWCSVKAVIEHCIIYIVKVSVVIPTLS